MHLGLNMFATDKSIAAPELAQAAEARGFESLFLPEHTHIPISRATPYPMGGELPEEYWRTVDPFVAFGACAAVTSTLRLGTGVCLVAQHDPIVLAKQVASADLLSGGRFVFGVGYGWNREEMQDHGVDPTRRRALVREKVLAMQRLWSDDVAAYDGDMVTVSPSWAWPKPVQRPHPPIFVGGAAGPTVFRHVVEFADGWAPIGGSGLRDTWPQLRAAAEEAGRDPDTIEIMLFGVLPDEGRISHYRDLGVTRVTLALPSAPATTVIPLLDRYAPLVEVASG